MQYSFENAERHRIRRPNYANNLLDWRPNENQYFFIKCSRQICEPLNRLLLATSLIIVHISSVILFTNKTIEVIQLKEFTSSHQIRQHMNRIRSSLVSKLELTIWQVYHDATKPTKDITKTTMRPA